MNNNGNYQGNQMENSVNTAPQKQPAGGLALASMIVGIVSCALSGYLVGGIVALVLGIVAKKQGNTSGESTCGIITGSISLGLYVVSAITSTIAAFFCIVLYFMFLILVGIMSMPYALI